MGLKDLFNKKKDKTKLYHRTEEELEEQKKKHCCMCGAPEDQVNLIIRGGGNGENYICDRCASMIHYQMTELYKYAEELKAKDKAIENPEPEIISVPTPHQIKEYLDDYIIGQDEVKIKISTAVYNHYKRVYQNEDDVDIEKSNILILGESGSGKSLIARTIAKMFDLPFTIVDANTFTQAGYVGEDVESILTRLYQSSGGDVNKTQRGIVFIDEIDKIARSGANPSITKDVSGEGVQQALLKLLEGSVVKVSPSGGRKHPEKEMIDIDTKNILFICAGAFVGIERTIGNRLNMRAVGFANEKTRGNIDKRNILKYVISDDIRNFGMIPELVGRLPVVAAMKPLNNEDLRRILTEPKNAIIKQYKKMFEMDGVKLTFDDDTLDYIVQKAIDLKLGARGLRSIVEEIMTQYMYDIPSQKKKKLNVTKEYAESVINSKMVIKEATV